MLPTQPNQTQPNCHRPIDIGTGDILAFGSLFSENCSRLWEHRARAKREHHGGLLVVAYNMFVTSSLFPLQVRLVNVGGENKEDRIRLYTKEIGNRWFCTFKNCKYSGYRWFHMVVHVRRHLNLKPYLCNFCSYASIQKSAVIRHTTKRHPGQPLQFSVRKEDLN